MIAAMKQNTWVDTLATFFAIIGRSVPSFVFAVVLPISLWSDFPNSTGLRYGIRALSLRFFQQWRLRFHQLPIRRVL